MRMPDIIRKWQLMRKRFKAGAEKALTRRSSLSIKQKQYSRYDSAYTVDALMAGSIGDEEEMYDELRRNVKALKGRIRRMPEAFQRTEFVQNMENAIPSLRSVKTKEELAQAVSLTHRYLQSHLSSTGGIKEYQRDMLKQAKEAGALVFTQEFTDKYGTLNHENLAKFMDFMSVQHAHSIGDYYGSERVAEFINVIGKETWDRLGETRAIEAFYLWVEQTEMVQALERGWSR